MNENECNVMLVKACDSMECHKVNIAIMIINTMMTT